MDKSMSEEIEQVIRRYFAGFGLGKEELGLIRSVLEIVWVKGENSARKEFLEYLKREDAA